MVPWVSKTFSAFAVLLLCRTVFVTSLQEELDPWPEADLELRPQKEDEVHFKGSFEFVNPDFDPIPATIAVDSDVPVLVHRMTAWDAAFLGKSSKEK